MELSGWLKLLRGRLRERPKAVATFDDHGAACRWPDGTVASVAWDQLRSVEIRTTEAGPFAEDVFLVLHADDSDCVVPQEAEGFGGLLERLQRLPGFDHEAISAAMTCTDNATFPCWRRADPEPGDAADPPAAGR
jgi:hypothetical protein